MPLPLSTSEGGGLFWNLQAQSSPFYFLTFIMLKIFYTKRAIPKGVVELESVNHRI